MRTLTLLIFLGALSTLAAQKQIETIKAGDDTNISVLELAGGLDHPWGMAFLPDGALLVTERNTGKLYRLSQDNKLSDPIEGTPDVHAMGQGGLLDVVVDPNFADNNYIYLSYAKPGDGPTSTAALGRGKLREGKLEDFEDIFVQMPYKNSSKHYGNRAVFSPDGRYIFFALGERFDFEPAQDLNTHLGKVVRIMPDGSVPKDNPFVNRKDAKGEIFSYGHRNIESMAFQPGTSALWVVEMGPLGGDELNHVERGANYGWPIVSWGDDYDGSSRPDPTTRPEFKDAATYWSPVISPSGMTFYEGDRFPQWRGNAFVGGLSSHAVVRLTFDGTQFREAENLPMPVRIRDVETAPDGSIYLLTDEDEGRILKMVPLAQR